MQTFCYSRVSSETQAESNGVDSQLDSMRHWLKGKRIDPDSCRWYSDLAVSGATMDRPEWERMLTDVAATEGETMIVVPDLTRAGRSLVGLTKWVDAMIRQGVRLVFVKESIDVGTPTGKLLLGILASVAEFELESIRERISRGVRTGRAKRDGKWGGQLVPMGAKGGPKLTQEQRAAIIERVKGGESKPKLAAEFGVGLRTIYNVAG